jgi:hypothetical protein
VNLSSTVANLLGLPSGTTTILSLLTAADSKANNGNGTITGSSSQRSKIDSIFHTIDNT